MSRPGLAILISGRGSNMLSILKAVQDGNIAADVRVVVSNKPDAAGLAAARAAGVTTEMIDHRQFAKREEFDRALAETIDRYDPQLLALAGFMRILTPEFIRRYQGRLINIHPSLLPAFPGLDTHRRALDAGATRHGATVHFVTPDVDAGPVIVQAAVPVLPGDTTESLAARVLEQEHRIYPLAIRWFLDGRLSVHNGRVRLDGAEHAEQGLG